MATLLIRLCGPMQSWGTRSRFTERDTELEPSKSGVVGMLYAALGPEPDAPHVPTRDRDVTSLASLRMGVRVDNEGTMARDYQTAGGVDGIVRASGAISHDAVLSNRYYLGGADFLVGLESDDTQLLQTIEAALRVPRWQLFLGRKSFVPSVPVFLPQSGLRAAALEDTLREEPWPLFPEAWPLPKAGGSLRLVLETTFDDRDHEIRMDQPLGVAFRDRTFGPRPIVQRFFAKERTHVPQPTSA